MPLPFARSLVGSRPRRGSGRASGSASDSGSGKVWTRAGFLRASFSWPQKRARDAPPGALGGFGDRHTEGSGSEGCRRGRTWLRMVPPLPTAASGPTCLRSHHSAGTEHQTTTNGRLDTAAGILSKCRGQKAGSEVSPPPQGARGPSSLPPPPALLSFHWLVAASPQTLFPSCLGSSVWAPLRRTPDGGSGTLRNPAGDPRLEIFHKVCRDLLFK